MRRSTARGSAVLRTMRQTGPRHFSSGSSCRRASARCPRADGLPIDGAHRPRARVSGRYHRGAGSIQWEGRLDCRRCVSAAGWRGRRLVVLPAGEDGGLRACSLTGGQTGRPDSGPHRGAGAVCAGCHPRSHRASRYAPYGLRATGPESNSQARSRGPPLQCPGTVDPGRGPASWSTNTGSTAGALTSAGTASSSRSPAGGPNTRRASAAAGHRTTCRGNATASGGPDRAGAAASATIRARGRLDDLVREAEEE